MRNIGKISETVLERSVLKPIKQNKVGIKKGAGIGLDCALFSDKGISTGYIAFKDSRACEHAIVSACNNLWAEGIKPAVVTLSVSLPDTFREIKLKEIMKQACETASTLGIKIAGGHTEYVQGLVNPVISVTAVGDNADGLYATGDYQTDNKELDIVMTKWMAISGTSIIARDKKEELVTKLPAYYIEDAAQLGQFTDISSEAASAVKPAGTVAMHDVAAGGIFTALWELCEKMGLGCKVDLNRIPVRQETIEVCEFYDINPYRLRGDGSLLIATTNGDKLVEELIGKGILATIIGHTTECIDRTVIRDEEIRFLEPANGDEIVKVMC